MNTPNNDLIHKALRETRNSFPELIKSLAINEDEKIKSWKNTLDTKLIPQMDPDFPLMVAVCGGGSSGKSTLFNSLIKKHVSSTGGKAGLSRRVLVAIHPEQLKKERFLNNLFKPFGTIPKELKEKKELTELGDPLYVADECVPKDIILLDTPDFDTGHDDKYANRDIAQSVLEASSVLIYIFTNATYNSLANKQFLSKMLRECGCKKSILIYRCYESYEYENVIEHTETVGKHLYEEEYKKHVLGVYRTNDHNEIAAGNKFMEFNAVNSKFEDIHELLKSLDPRTLRKDELDSSLNEYISFLENVSSNAKESLDELEMYVNVCKIEESHAIANALKEFPILDFTQKLAKEWEATSPKPIKWLRNTGKVVCAPVKGLFWVAKKFKKTLSNEKSKKDINFKDVFSKNLLNSANTFRNSLLSDSIVVEASIHDKDVKEIIIKIDKINKSEFKYEKFASNYNIFTKTHNALKKEKKKIQEINLDNLSDNYEQIAEEIQVLPGDFEKDISKVIKEFRENMGKGKKIREILFASLPALTIIGSVVFVFATAGTGALGLFGLGDLYALIAIPASVGLNKADRDQLQKLIQPVFDKWFVQRRDKIKLFLREAISGSFFDESNKQQDKNGKLINEIDKSISIFKELVNE